MCDQLLTADSKRRRRQVNAVIGFEISLGSVWEQSGWLGLSMRTVFCVGRLFLK